MRAEVLDRVLGKVPRLNLEGAVLSAIATDIIDKAAISVRHET